MSPRRWPRCWMSKSRAERWAEYSVRSSSNSRPRLRTLVDHAALHHEADLLQYSDIFERIARHRDDVGIVAGLDRADLPIPSEHLRAVERAGLERSERRHPVLHHQFELVRLRAVRKRSDIGTHGHGNARRKLLLEFARVNIERLAPGRCLRGRFGVFGE